jgi:hypothetical protein
MRRTAVLLAVFAATAAWADQPVTLDFGAEFAAYGSLVDSGAGPVVSTRDSLNLDLELRHELGGGIMTYGLSGGIRYAPQDLAAGDELLLAVLAFPGVSGFGWESGQPRLRDPWFRIRAGRLQAQEASGLLFRDPWAVTPSQLMDGASAEARVQWFYVSVEAGFLGLLDKRINRIVFTAQDRAELADAAVYPAPPRGLAILDLEAQEVLLGQSIALFGVLQKDFRPEPPTFDSWYIGVTTKGSVLKGLRQESSVIAAITVPSDGEVGAGLMVSATLAYELGFGPLGETWLAARWGSGEGGGLRRFPVLAGPVAAASYPEPLADLVSVELGIDASLAVAPAEATLDPALAVRLLLTPDGNIPAGYGFAPAGPYIGTEIEASLSYDPLAGLAVDARGGILITAGGAFPFFLLGAEVKL